MLVALVAGLLAAYSTQQGDAPTFSDAATAELYARARVRHVRQDSLVRDYTAVVETRLDFSAGRSRFARQTALVARENVARVTWRRPNDLKIEALGARTAAPIFRIVAAMGGDREDLEEAEEEFRQDLWFDRPWFIPRGLGDRVQLMGVPDQAALHPLAEGATDHYRYAITDSVRISVPGRDVRAVKMRVQPKRLGPSQVAGDMWIDRETGDVVRLVVVFLGEYLWQQPGGETPKDSADARNENKWANRFVSVEADIEYALVENLYWLPHRQLLAITIEIPWFLNATLPVRAISNFRDYRVNVTPQFSFAVPPDLDSLEDREDRSRARPMVAPGVAGDSGGRQEELARSGYFRAGSWIDGRWEIEVPPADSLLAYQWNSDFRLSLDRDEEQRFRESLVSLARLSEELPTEWVGRTRYGLAWERFSDIVRFNRVQGLSLGVGYQVRPGPQFTTLHAAARFGLGDLRPTGSLTWRRDGPGGRLDLTAYRDVREAEPWTGGLGVGNSLNAIFTGHDDADYYLALGGGFSYQWNEGLLRDVEFAAYLERHQSMITEVDAPVPGLFGPGVFPANPAAAEGTFVRGRAGRPISIGIGTLRPGVEVLRGDSLLAGRVWGSAAILFRVFQRTGTLSLRAGASTGDNVPQLAFRLGGPYTVRGFPYGERTGREFWSAQLDFAVLRSAYWAPVVFVDAGDTFSSDPMIGGGAGMSLLNGLLRFSLSKGIRPRTDVRFDLLFRAPR